LKVLNWQKDCRNFYALYTPAALYSQDMSRKKAQMALQVFLRILCFFVAQNAARRMRSK
jgi:hypothetical protein